MRERKTKPKAKKGQKSKAAQHRQSCSGLGGFMIALLALAAGAYYFRPTTTPPIVEEQTPAIVVGVVEEHHHVLQYYAREVAKNTVPIDGRATILHLDSHADMGVPRAYLQADEHMERYSAINDFMITAALTGVAEHLVFVEPPWSNQFRCCVYEGSATFQFTVGVDSNNQVRVAGPMARRLGHVFWRDGETRTASVDDLSNTRDFRITVINEEHARLDDILVESIDASKPLILDIDLDYFATENFGAIPLRDELGVSDEDLMTAYHLAWDFPELSVEYLRKGDHKAREAASFDTERARRAIAGGQKSALATHFREAVSRRTGVSQERRSLLREFLASIPIKSGHLRGDEPDVFFEQPFHVPEPRALSDEVDFALDDMLAARILPRLQRPVLVNIVRSPGYVPVRYLSLLECRTLRTLRDVYGAFEVSHEGRVDVTRTGCEGSRSVSV
jgi:hypothetical protein